MSAEPKAAPVPSVHAAPATSPPSAEDVASKVDPEAFAIRARPRPAIRFRRGLIVAISAAGSVGLIAVTWKALEPSVFRQVAQEVDLSQASGKGPPDALSGLPATYGDVPRLGPPLPGDLGRPILERQRQLAAADPVADPVGQVATGERERLLAERKAARESGLLVQAATRPATAAAPSGADVPEAAAEPAPTFPRTMRDQGAQQGKTGLPAVSGQNTAVNPHAVRAAPSPYLLSAGSVISASLITGLRSDLPGVVIAQVTERVFDSPTGRHLLIPQGARLIGSYDSVIAFGQSRALVSWQRIIWPDGRSLQLDNVPATDPSGFAGLSDRVDFHTWTLLKGVAISTLLGVGSNLTFSGESDLVEAIRESSQDNVARAGDQLTSRNLQIRPTITVRQGAAVRLVVHRDLVFTPASE
jgi:type IV secretion system protein VirB10